MSDFVDCVGRTLNVNDKVGVAFSYSQASVGYIRIGNIISLDPFHMHWEKDGKVSPKMVFSAKRMVLLDGA